MDMSNNNGQDLNDEKLTQKSISANLRPLQLLENKNTQIWIGFLPFPWNEYGRVVGINNMGSTLQAVFC
jgi:hypothetical protein